MSELSPAAKAILVAEAKSRCLREERGCHPTDSDWNGCWICVHRKGVAAAIEALADQVVPKEWPTIEDYNEYDQGFAAAHIKYRNQILDIAAELEA